MRAIFLFIVAFILFGCKEYEQPLYKELEGAQMLYSTTSQQMKSILQDNGYADEASAADGIVSYKLVYDSIDAYGNPTKASGAITIPYAILRGEEAKEGVLFLHGTITNRNEAPSVIAKSAITYGGATFASVAGSIVLEPDYLGFGESAPKIEFVQERIGEEGILAEVPIFTPEAYHPYLQKDPLTEDILRFLEVAYRFLTRHNLIKTNRLYITGYSEGGWLAASLSERISSAESPFDLSGLIFMSGAYDLESVAEYLFGDMFEVYPVYSALTLITYATKQGIDIADLIVPNDTYLGFKHNFATQMSSLSSLNAILASGFLDFDPSNDYAPDPGFVSKWQSNEPFWFREMLRENSPKAMPYDVRVDLIHCRGDTLLPLSHARRFAEQLRSSGAQEVRLLVPDHFGASRSHEACFLPALQTASKIVRGEPLHGF